VIFICFIPRLSFAANSTPTSISVLPNYGSSPVNTAVNFTTTFSDANGWQNIQFVYFLINTSTASAKCFYGYYNQNTNKLYLRNDAGTSWIGGFAPGSTNTIENSYVKLNCALTTVLGSGTTMTIKWNAIFKTAFSASAAKNLYLYVKDDTNLYQSWTVKGSWLVGSNVTPTLGTLSVNLNPNLTNQLISFTAIYSDTNGYKDLQTTRILINTKASSTNCVYAQYNQNTNKLYLLNDSGETWLGGFAPASANIIENSYGKLDCSKTTVTVSGSNLNVKWGIIFKEGFLSSSVKNLYLYANDDTEATSGVVQKSDYCILGETIALPK